MAEVIVGVKLRKTLHTHCVLHLSPTQGPERTVVLFLRYRIPGVAKQRPRQAK